MEWFQKSAAQGNARAQYILGGMYLNGSGVPKDISKAIEWLGKAAAQGDAEAQLTLGAMNSEGTGMPKDSVKAVEWFKKAAVQGNARAQYVLGLTYDIGDDAPRDIVKAIEWFEKAAAQGHADAQFSLGQLFNADGLGVTKDTAKAMEWFQKSAAQGNPRAQYSLALLYLDGKSVPKDAIKAAEWTQKAATQGNADAQAFLGSMYMYGEGVPKDEITAIEWLQKAATQGNARAQFNLGKSYYLGLGVPKDAIKALEWLEKAATQGSADAQTAVGEIYHGIGSTYYKGDDVPIDATKAVEWFRKSATYGYANGQLMLSICYFQGRGIPKDNVLGYAWANLAAGTGSEDAATTRAIIEKEMPPTAIAEAQRISSSWKKGVLLAREGKSVTQSARPSNTSVALMKEGTGTAFLVAKTGQAITNHHVIDGCKEVRVQGRDGVAKLVTSDKVNDLALLQVTGTITATAPLNAEPSKLRQGEDVVVYGFPLNSLLSSGGNFTPGMVSALTGLGNNTNQIQITAPIQPGSSGSAVLNKRGEVVGVVAMKLSDSMMAKATGQVGQNVNFAVSGQTLRTFLDTHQVPYTSGTGFFSREKGPADLAEEARKWTLLVECWK
jgi:TPR repeat protein